MRIDTEGCSLRGEGALKAIAVLAVIGLLGAGVALWAQTKRHKARVAELQAQHSALQVENQKHAEQQAAADEARKTGSQENMELVRLRGEVASLRPLQKQVQQLQGENQQLKATVQQLQQATAETAALRNQTQQLQGALQAKTHADACVANLRNIEAAKAAWAAQYQKQPGEVAADEELFGPGKPLPQKPVCPANGVYTVGPVQSKPVCNVPGHAY